MRNYQNKTISVNSKGLIITFTDSNKHQFIKFENQDVPRRMPAKYQEIEKPVFNEKQQKMYSEALYGLNIYSEEQIKKMPKSVVMKIAQRCQAVQMIINRWKQEIVNDRVDGFLLKLFPKSPVVKQITSVKGYDDSIKSTIPFKDLQLNQQKIAQKLVSLRLLPENFFQL